MSLVKLELRAKIVFRHGVHCKTFLRSTHIAEFLLLGAKSTTALGYIHKAVQLLFSMFPSILTFNLN